MILVVYLSHRIFHPVAVSFFSPNQFFGRGLQVAKLRNLRKNVVHIYRSTRLAFFFFFFFIKKTIFAWGIELFV